MKSDVDFEKIASKTFGRQMDPTRIWSGFFGELQKIMNAARTTEMLLCTQCTAVVDVSALAHSDHNSGKKAEPEVFNNASNQLIIVLIWYVSQPVTPVRIINLL
eukprot:g11936.t1